VDSDVPDYRTSQDKTLSRQKADDKGRKFDSGLSSGEQITIEEQNAAEVTGLAGKAVAPAGVKAYNAARRETMKALMDRTDEADNSNPLL